MRSEWRRTWTRIGRWGPVQAVIRLPGRLDDELVRLFDRAIGRILPWAGRAIAWGGAAAARIRAVLRPIGPPIRHALSRIRQGWARWGSPSCVIGLLFAVAAWVPSRVTGYGRLAMTRLLDLDVAALDSLPPDRWQGLYRLIEGTAGVLILLLPLAALGAFLRRRWVLRALRLVAALWFVHLLLQWRWVLAIPSWLRQFQPDAYGNAVRNELWTWGTIRILPWILGAAGFGVALGLRRVAVWYGADEREGWPDRLWDNLRTHGEDPPFRKAIYASGFLHLLVLFILPLIGFHGGCMELPYGIPQGSGTPMIEMIKVRKIQKKPEKKFIVNLQAPISFYVPKIEDSDVLEELDRQTEQTYEAQQIGKLGAGGGKQGGWPNGMERAKVRFIRLEYDGGDWDQDMGFGADYNMLLKFREFTGFDIWPTTESIRIAQLKRFPRNRAPPFVYLTGGLQGGINVSQAEVKILREYCLEMGGMIFADNGGGNFDRNFRALMKRVFPELPLVVISKDDVIFQYPFYFPNGAPPLWHHSGKEALGIKYQGRWVVFYHQGDINDAWKTGHSGASPTVANQAYKLGVNIIYYAFTQYMAINFGGEVPK